MQTRQTCLRACHDGNGRAGTGWHRLAAARSVRCIRLSASVSPKSKVLESGDAPVVAVPAVAGVAREAERAGDGGQHAEGPRVEEAAAALVALAGRRLRARQAQPDVRHRLRQQHGIARFYVLPRWATLLALHANALSWKVRNALKQSKCLSCSVHSRTY